jgi:plastocyanin
MSRLSAAVGLTLAVVMASASCALAGGAARIVIDESDFKPARLVVHIGDTVAWVNKDFVDHTATATNGAFDLATPKGRTVTQRMTKAGEYAYVCRLHPNMTGVIVVEK